MRLAVMVLFVILIYFPWMGPGGFNLMLFYMLAAALPAVVIAALANGERGRPVKWLFYWTYPGHLLLFGIFRILGF
jgi:hypothetical protein